jgi:nitrite reductase/ring-hydroxylating ferredoxin subunit
MVRHVIAAAEEIPSGARKRVSIEGRDIVVFNVEGELFALSDKCPHRGASLSEGVLTGLVVSREPGCYTYERAGEIIRCPWHQWEFDLRTGRSQCDPKRMRAMAFQTSVETGTKILEGPYKAETFKVGVENAYVVIEVE